MTWHTNTEIETYSLLTHDARIPRTKDGNKRIEQKQKKSEKEENSKRVHMVSR